MVICFGVIHTLEFLNAAASGNMNFPIEEDRDAQ